jgi:ribose transport system substrate-binding protein
LQETSSSALGVVIARHRSHLSVDVGQRCGEARTMQRRQALLLLGMMAAASGCDDGTRPSTSPSASADAAKGTADNPWLIGMSQCNLGEPWRVQMNEDIERAAAKHPNLKLVFKDAQNDSLRQRAQVEELAGQKVDAILISPKETAPLTKPVAEAFDAGTPVIVIDRRVAGEKFTVFIGADNEKIGREAGKHVAKMLGGKGKVVELKGLMTSSPAQGRHKGFLAGLDQETHPELEVVFEADMQWLEPNARKEMESALATHEQIDLVYAHNDPGAHGAWLAAKAADRHGAIRFVGIDALAHEGVRYVKEGILDATFAYPTGGDVAVETALKILKGDKVPKEITLGTRRYTKDDVAKGGTAID